MKEAMWNLFKNKHKTCEKLARQKEIYGKQFFSIEHHSWINRDTTYKKAFSLLLDSFNQNIFDSFKKQKKDILFLKSSGKLACSISTLSHSHVILIYPDLAKLLKSAIFLQGIAILAHELGHLYHDHGNQKIDPLQAQIEADHFACHLGFGYELQKVLLEHNHSLDCRTRVSYLTAEYLKINPN